MRHSLSKYVLIVLLLFCLMSFSATKAKQMQSWAIALLSPIWELVDKFAGFFHIPHFYAEASSPCVSNERRLELDNQLLRMQLKQIQDLFVQEMHLNVALTKQAAFNQELQTVTEKHFSDTEKLLHMQLQAVPAHVISRLPSLWNSSLWVDVGEADNERLGQCIIAKNSPVLFGSSVVGVVEYIGKHQSRIRLITDGGLTPSVRSLRSSNHSELLVMYIDNLIEFLHKQGHLFIPQAHKKDFFLKMMGEFKETLGVAQEPWYLAKGELQGSGNPAWRKCDNTLKGIGFNYDIPDEAGPARDLRTGQPTTYHAVTVPTMPILKVGDLLVTTGMDGVFPPGLPIAEVTKIHLLREGDYTYELEAKPTAGNLEELALVFIIPPVQQ